MAILEEKRNGADLIGRVRIAELDSTAQATGSVWEWLAMKPHRRVEVVHIPVCTEVNKYERENHESERSHDGHAIHLP